MLILASASTIRASLLRNAGLAVTTHPARIDEVSLRESLLAENATHRDIADTLAEIKARQIAAKHPDAMVLGCDQILSHQGQILAKPRTPKDARDQLSFLKASTHTLFSAAVLYHRQQPIWRHVGVARLTMRDVSDRYADEYIDRNWPDLQNSVGAYQIEAEGIRLFSQIDGDLFTVQGLPLLPLLNILSTRQDIPA